MIMIDNNEYNKWYIIIMMMKITKNDINNHNIKQ